MAVSAPPGEPLDLVGELVRPAELWSVCAGHAMHARRELAGEPCRGLAEEGHLLVVADEHCGRNRKPAAQVGAVWLCRAQLDPHCDLAAGEHPSTGGNVEAVDDRIAVGEPQERLQRAVGPTGRERQLENRADRRAIRRTAFAAPLRAWRGLAAVQ